MFKKFLAIILTILTVSSNVNSKAFAESYLEKDKPLVVEITTDWCFACKLLKPIMEEIKSEYSGKVTFISLNLTNEESTREAERLAAEYGISEFFKNNRNAFPRVGIFCSSGLFPEKNILGAAAKEIYKESLDSLVSNSCTLSSNFALANMGDGRPVESEFIEIAGSRPDEPAFLERPREMNSSGRPEELTFWTYGQQIPTLAYLHFWVLPQCAGNNQYICSNQAGQTEIKPAFKPWNPNATRNEKGFKFVNRG